MTTSFTRQLLCCGDATDLKTWSNTPYFILQAGLRCHLIQGGLALFPQHMALQRLIWNMRQYLRTGKPGGYQYSSSFTRGLLAQAGLNQHQPLGLLSQFPLLPPCPWPEHWLVDFYIDATTLQVFDDYGYGSRIDDHYRDDVLQREKLAYECSGSVICMSQWAANSVIFDYGIDAAKVHVVPGGANLDEAILTGIPDEPLPFEPSLDHPLRLGFLGKEWNRKGGPFLLKISEELEALGIPSVIRAIGPDPSLLPSHPALQPLGFINKQDETNRFVSELRSWHFGMLFSTAEASPRSNLECLRLGVPVLSHDVGGIASTVPDEGCGHLFSPHPSVEDVVSWIVARLTSYQEYLDWRVKLTSRWREFTWNTAMDQLDDIFNS